ncbi:MAG: bifunctional 5,10-methylenetetrahydrofolate dehydrogenase/5,10-methenyltetrahydrofolate cyclohydrolase [Planctomycetota bacterium]|nr:MAG: bifunctional 5,10-methylenetetrahydrofolate dehydrogenase/5,10-methenyltetrahydrofolate cyclohydrolase [Planctomycetota bacterium]
MSEGPAPGGATVLNGREIARAVRESIAQRVAAIRRRGGAVRLDAILAAPEDSAAALYAQSQGRACAEVGIDYRLHRLDAGATFDDLAGRVLLLNSDESVTGVMAHLPLPEGVDAYRVQRLIAPEKDVEGVNPANIGNIVYGRSSLAPCTAVAAVAMIETAGQDLRGRVCVVVGASNIVGKPIAVLLMRQDATVVSTNKFTPALPSLTRRADVLVSAAGVPGLITADMVKPGAVVVDVGTTRVTDHAGATRTVGDVAFDEVSRVAGWISPVPGGVGPVTVAMLLRNAVDAAERRGVC